MVVGSGLRCGRVTETDGSHGDSEDQLRFGTAVIEVSDASHSGCAKFPAHFGRDAIPWVSSPTGRAYRMRGVFAGL